MGDAHLAPPQKKARELKARLVFVDESGFSLIPTLAKTWARRGETPVLRHRMNWPKISAISAVTHNPHVYSRVMRGTVRSEQAAQFDRHLLRCLPGRVWVCWDGLGAHWSRATRNALAPYAHRLRLVRLPAYAPELNPDEWVWAHLKAHELRGLCPDNGAELMAAVRRGFRRIRGRPRLIRSFFHASGLSF